jgi:predicted nicotinamide N-methyase
MSRSGVYGLTDRVLTVSHAALSTDVHVEQRPDESATAAADADGTYRRLWPTAVILARHLCAHPELVRGKRVVELGAGSGAVGLVCAALGAAHVWITDVPGALPLVCDNLRRNESLHSSGAVSVAPCTWGERPHVDALLADGGAFDVVLSCEVVYKQEAATLEALLQTQQALLADVSDACVLLAYEFRSNLLDDFAYFGPAADAFEVEQISLRPYEGAPARPCRCHHARARARSRPPTTRPAARRTVRTPRALAAPRADTSFPRACCRRAGRARR